MPSQVIKGRKHNKKSENNFHSSSHQNREQNE